MTLVLIHSISKRNKQTRMTRMSWREDLGKTAKRTRQRAANLLRDKYQKGISEDRWGDREWRSYTGMSQKRERGVREEMSKI